MKYKYRKVTPEMLIEMKKLKQKGFNYTEIGKIFGVAYSSVQYHLDKKTKLLKLKAANKFNSKLTKKEVHLKNKKRQPYLNKYMKERYNEDEKFREKIKEISRRCNKERENNRKRKGLCPECGKERKDKNYIKCAKCREKYRKWCKNKKE